MKKLLLSVALLATINSFGQKLLTENFDGLTIGPLSGDGWISGGAGTNEIVNGNGGQVLETESASGPIPEGAVNQTYFVKDLGWSGRDSGNDTVEFTFDLITGTPNGNSGYSKLVVDGATVNSVAGFYYFHDNNELAGDVRILNADYDSSLTEGENSIPTKSIYIPLASNNTTSLILNSNTKYTLSCIIDTNNNAVILSVDGVEVLSTQTNIDLTDAVYEPDLFTGQNYASQETTSYKYQIDNISVDATNRNTLSTNSVIASKFAVFPNPSNGSDFVNFTGDNIQATGATVFNLLGKEVLKVSQNELANKQINISSLAKGMYLLNIETPEGVATKKIIKN